MVIVVGAGPAGAVAARTLASAGVPVTLLDRHTFPRNKPCGGGISIRVLKRFPWLERELSDIVTHRISRLYLEGPDGHSTTITSDEPAVLMVRRVEFDALLVDLAVRAGATLVSGAEVVRVKEAQDGVVLESRDGRRFDAAAVVAADGVHSVVARRLGLNPGWPAGGVALDMMEETPRELLAADPSALWVAYGFGLRRGDSPDVEGRGAAHGYAYIFPKRDHINVGIGYVLDHFRRLPGVRPYDVQSEFVEHLRDRGIVTGRSSRAHFTPSIIPVGGPLPRPGRGRVLLAGDAGGFVNGFTAEGIYYAMVTGELAARAIADAGASNTARVAERYRRACAREIGAELRDSVLIQKQLFADRRRIARVIQAAAERPSLTRAVLDYAIGRASYRTARRRVIAGAPLMAVRLAWQSARHVLSPRLATDAPPGRTAMAGETARPGRHRVSGIGT